MRRVMVERDGAVAVVDVAEPVPQLGEALVAVRAVGICGSDLHAVRGTHPFVALPYAPGHEVVGEVIAFGEGVTSVAVGDRVIVEPPLPCGWCRPCRSGDDNVCENLAFFGCGWPQGGMAERFTLRADRLHRIPDTLDDRAAAVVEPLSTPVHAARLAGGLTGARVAILGAGTIGLLALAVARADRADRVVMTARRAVSMKRALTLGADVAVDATTDDAADRVRDALGGGANVVIDCVGSQPTLDLAFDTVRNGGSIVIVGVPAAAATIPLPRLQDRQIRLQGSATYVADDIDRAIRLVAAGAVDVDALVTMVLSLDQAADGFRASASGEHVKVLLRP